MVVKLGRKFTANNFEEIVDLYWQAAKEANDEDVIHFDLSQIEWIALEELTFLFGWFRFLILNQRKLKVHLPPYQSEFKKHNQLINLWGKWKIFSFMPLLPIQAKITDYFNVDTSVNRIIDDQIRKDFFRQENLDEDITVVPFQHISTYGYGNVKSIDELVVNRIHKPLNLAKQVYEVLQKHTNIDAKDNLLLSKIITNELFLNVLHHSFQINTNGFDECYFAISLKRKITKASVARTENSRRTFERQKLTKETFQAAAGNITPVSDEEAEEKLQYLLLNTIPKGYEEERLSETLNFFKDKSASPFPFKNETYIEFTFLDFGQGIPSSLRANYLEEFDDPNKKRRVLSDLNDLHILQNIDTRILEYAFLLNSSRHPLDIELQTDFEIPRGLYHIVDIVRRHKGMITARSRCGKIIYNFSEPVTHVKKAVTYVQQENQLSDFQGTMISITIPANQEFTKLKGPALPPHMIPDKIPLRTSHYFPIAGLIEDIQPGDNGFENVTLQRLYHLLFAKIGDIFLNYKEAPCLLIFDFAGVDITPIEQKLLFYFTTSPYVNAQTSVVLLNIFDNDIVEDARKAIKFKLQNAKEANYIYKPIPIINADDNIYWLGVQFDEDELMLTELLKYEDHFISNKDLKDFSSYQGVFFDIDKYGNITTKIPSHQKIMDLAKKYGKDN